MATATTTARKSKIKELSAAKVTALDFIHSIESNWKAQEKFALWLIQKLHPKVTLDLGFDQGLSTLLFGHKNSGNVYGIDWFYEEGSYAEKSLALDSAFRNISQAIRFNYVKNIHLIIGPSRDVLKNWNRKIDLLHLNSAYTYQAVKIQYDNWQRHLKDDAVLLLHNVLSHPTEVGRFFTELPFPKVLLENGQGLGVVSANEELITEIRDTWPNL